MTFIGLIFIVLYILIFTKSFVNISRGNFEYLLYYICLALPFYATLQAQVFEIFNNELLVNLIKLSKDFIFFYALLIFILGKNEYIVNRTFTFSNLDKLFLSFVILIILYTIIPLGEADLISKIIYAKNILIIPLVYFMGRNLEFSNKAYMNLKKIFLGVIITSFVFVFFEFIFSTHFHRFINYSNYNSTISVKANLNALQELESLSIIDQGIGIAQEDLSKITQKFYRVDESRNNIISGHGLGLTIVNQILNKNGYKLEFTSELGVGSCFTIKF